MDIAFTTREMARTPIISVDSPPCSRGRARQKDFWRKIYLGIISGCSQKNRLKVNESSQFLLEGWDSRGTIGSLICSVQIKLLVSWLEIERSFQSWVRVWHQWDIFSTGNGPKEADTQKEEERRWIRFSWTQVVVFMNRCYHGRRNNLLCFNSSCAHLP